MYVWACVVVVERCGEGCGCVSYSRGMCGGVSMRVVGWTCTLYCEHHERYIWTLWSSDGPLCECMRVRMDGIRAHYGATATAGCTTGVVVCRRASMRRDDDENMGDDRRRRDDRRVRGACVRVRCDA